MNSRKRKPFLIKGNFQITFIAGFILLLFTEVITAAFVIYNLSYGAIEKELFRSHLSVGKSAQIIGPIIIKINLLVILISILLAGLTVTITYLKYRALFREIIIGFENLRDNHTSFRMKLRGGKNTRDLITKFNQAASRLDRHLIDLRDAVDSLLQEKEIKSIAELHNKLYSIIANQDYS